MRLFPCAHSAHPQWQLAVASVLSQLRAQCASPAYAASPSLGLLYLTDGYARDAREILAALQAELPVVTDWAGGVGLGICATGTEYFEVPALALMLLDIPADQYRVFSGVAPLGLGFEAQTALVHADGTTPDIDELVREMAARTDSGFLFGGLTYSRSQALQFAVAGNGNIRGHGAASGVFKGGMSGIALSDGVTLISRVTQGCKPISAERRITAADGNLVLELDHEPALQVLLDDLSLSLDQPDYAIAVLRNTLVGLVDSDGTLTQRTGNFGNQVTVRAIIGLDAARLGVAVGATVTVGMRMAFCERNIEAARADLVRACAEICDALEGEESPSTLACLESGQPMDVPTPRPIPAPSRMVGAVYVSCVGRGGLHFGAPHAELALIRRTLGDVPLVGFFADGEIAYDHVYGYTGVLTVFTAS